MALELVPDIAYGNLATSSLAEVVAAAFRANATGTISVEQGTGESRVYVNYGSPCGTSLLVPSRTFGAYLVEAGAIEADRVAPLVRKAEQRKESLSNLLIAEHVLPSDQVLSFLAAYHHDELVSLCLVREGKYELRGWERPPDWTESIHLDPLRAIISALSAPELTDRRQAILALIGDRPLGVSSDFEDLAGRLYVDDLDVQAIQLLRTPMPVAQYLEMLGGPSFEAAVVAYAMLGLIDEQADQPVFAPSQPIHIEEFGEFPVMVEEAEAPRSSPGRQSFPSALEEEDAVDVQFDIEPAQSPLAGVFDEESVVFDESVGSWSDDMASRLDEALTGNASLSEGDGFATLPQGLLTNPESSAFPSMASAHTEPVSTMHSSESRGLLGQLEFEAPDALDSLELDLKRAPKEILRDSLDRGSRLRPARKSSGTTDPMLPKVRVGAPSSTVPAGPATTIVGRGAARGGSPARPRANRADEYNPFRPHFRKRTAAVAVAVGAADPLDDALERALRPSTRPAASAKPSPEARFDPRPPEAPTRANRAPPPRSAPSLPPEPQTIVARPSAAETAADSAMVESLLVDSLMGETPMVESPMVASPVEDFHAAIEESFPARPSQAEDSGPLDIPQEAARVGEGDALALDLARSEALEEDVGAFVADDDAGPQTEPGAPGPSLEEGPSEEGPSEELSLEEQAEAEIAAANAAVDYEDPPAESVVEEKTPPRPAQEETTASRAREAGADVRRRLLQRAMRNVSGPFQTRDQPVETARPADPFAVPPSTEVVDAELEKDLDERARKGATGDHFITLDLEKNASTDQVKAAFLVLAKQYHPDRLSSQGQTHLLPKARDVFARVKDAYDVLLDPATRARHLNELDAKSGGGRKLSQDDAKGAYQRAQVYLKRRDWKQAEAELVRAIDSNPAPEYLAELAWTLLSNPNRRDEAKDEIKSLVARSLKGVNLSDRVFVVAAHMARNDGDLGRMEKFFRSALEKNPKNVEAARELRLIELRRPVEKPAGLLDRFRKK